MPDLDETDGEISVNQDMHLEQQPDNTFLITEKIIIFTVLGKQYGFPSGIIAEIVRFDTVFPLPLLPLYLPGVVSRYSIPYALFDIGVLFNNIQSPRNKILFFKEEFERIAILIDDVTDIADISIKDFISADIEDINCKPDFSTATSFKWNNEVVLLLDARSILNHVTKDINIKKDFY